MPRRPSATTNFGRRFWVLAALSLGPAVATSFARFAYALILPAMRAELDLSYWQAGSLNTANALGYLVGALLCTRYVPRLGNRRLFSFGLVVTVLALLGAGLAESFGEQMALRAVAGMSSAMVYISGAVLVSNLYPDRPEVSKSAIAIYFGGAGAGIVMSGVGIPWLLATLGDAAWRSAWLAIGGISVFLRSRASGRHAGSWSRRRALRLDHGRRAHSRARSRAISFSGWATSPT